MNRSLFTTAVVSILSIYTAIALFGMALFMMPSEHGGMIGGGCPLMRDVGSLCQTGILDHMTHWNILFATTLVVIVFFAVAIATVYMPVGALAISPPHERYRQYVKDTPQVRIFQPTIRLFSDGILQPKLYA